MTEGTFVQIVVSQLNDAGSTAIVFAWRTASRGHS